MSFSSGSGSSRIATSSDVSLSNPATNDVLTYNATTQKWVNQPVVASTALLVVNVREAPYNAVGDGTTDDTAALKAAMATINGRGGGMVVMPGGYTYKVTASIVIPANTTVSCYGATLKKGYSGSIFRNDVATANPPNGYTNSGGIVLQGGTFDCGGTAYNGLINCITFRNAQDITVKDIIVLNNQNGHGLEFNACINARALNCSFYGFVNNYTSDRSFSEAIQIDIDNTNYLPCKGILVSGCVAGPSPTCGSWGRLVGTHSAAVGTVTQDVRIIGCRADSTLDTSIRAYQWKDVVIADNEVISPGVHGIQSRTGDPNSASYGGSDPFDRIIISNNTIINAATNGIDILGYASAPGSNIGITGNLVQTPGGNGINVQYAVDVNISNNVIRNTTGHGVAALNMTGLILSGNNFSYIGVDGASLVTCPGVFCHGNRIRTCGSYGFAFNTNADDGVFTDNFVTASDMAAYRISGTCNNCVISNNVARMGSSSNAEALSITNTCTSTLYRMNDFRGYGSTAINDAGVSSVTSTGNLT